jgi:hypothetical protein
MFEMLAECARRGSEGRGILPVGAEGPPLD